MRPNVSYKNCCFRWLLLLMVVGVVACSKETPLPDPFAIDQIPNRNIYNFLVEVSYTVAGNNYVDYAWMPMNDALIAGSRGLPYELQITLSN